jgi:hypothetical protein
MAPICERSDGDGRNGSEGGIKVILGNIPTDGALLVAPQPVQLGLTTLLYIAPATPLATSVRNAL